MARMIFTGFSPNLKTKDVFVALKFLFLPWQWLKLKRGKAVIKVENWLKKYFAVNYAFTFDSGRSSLYLALRALGIGAGDEVLSQAYTCVVVSNAIRQTGAKPVYIDIDNDFNIDPEELKKRITNKSKALIAQHTFGLAAPLEKLLTIARQYDLKIIEDCAHSLGARHQGKLLGAFSDIAVLSFGADKIVSCARGGALITNNHQIANKIANLQKQLKPMSAGKILQHLSHFPIFFMSKPLYHLKIGKIILGIVKKYLVINKIIEPTEKQGKKLLSYPALLPNCLAEILLGQLTELEKVNKHRQKVAQTYSRSIKNKKIKLPLKDKNDCVYLRYPVLTENPNELLKYAKIKNIILGDWYNNVIAPADIDIEKTGYQRGSCPKAELLASQSANLPTDRHIKAKQIKRIINAINSF